MIILNQIKFGIDWKKSYTNFSSMLVEKDSLIKKAARELKIDPKLIKNASVVKHSLDARKKPDIIQVCSVAVYLEEEASEEKLVNKLKNNNIIYSKNTKFEFICDGVQKLKNRPIIIGMGPAGLFAGYYLAKNGFKPLILERGQDVDTRTEDVEKFWSGEKLNTESNVQFGEGGAGTFSDGKLNTLIKDKDGRNKEVLKVFVECGAPEEILYSSKPHIGTDILKVVVKNMREKIISFGGEVRFGAKVTDFIINNNEIEGVIVNNDEKISSEAVILAIGHSARDTFYKLLDLNANMEPKAFAVGMRVEHPQLMINNRMYGEHGKDLPAAPYKITAKTSTGRGVYSFCMCPGGYVVNASSEENRLAVNGMSYSKRDSKNANSAIIITVTPEDFPNDGPLGGVEFQRQLEEKAYNIGKGKIPVQYFEDYKANVSSVKKEFEPCIKGQYIFGNLRGMLPDELEKAFIEGMEQFDKVIPGYPKKAILDGMESRTSSPVRIVRDENYENPNIRGLYPCGEGAGYAGGITSAGMDGILIAQQIAHKYKA